MTEEVIQEEEATEIWSRDEDGNLVKIKLY